MTPESDAWRAQRTNTLSGVVRDLQGAAKLPSGEDAGMRRVRSMQQLGLEEEPAAVPVWRVALTGGPCGGKTTALSIIAGKLRSRGLQVFTVPENATMFSTAGAGFPVHSNEEHQLTWETSRMICQMQMEDTFTSIAKASGRATVILCDRGVVDASAYMSRETWEKVLNTMEWDEAKLRDERYDMVMHMVSTADGAESHYVNTVYRHETVQQAAALDGKIKAAWKLHRNRCEIDNSTGYDEKVKRVVNYICRRIGLGGASDELFTSTYLLDAAVMAKERVSFPKAAEDVHTLIVMLQNSVSEDYSFVRARRQKGCYSFVHGRSTPSAHSERQTSQEEFVASLALAHPQLEILNFDQVVWVENTRDENGIAIASHSYELSLERSAPGLCTLKVETNAASPPDAAALPEWLRPYVKQDISKNDSYQEFELARRLALGQLPGASSA